MALGCAALANLPDDPPTCAGAGGACGCGCGSGWQLLLLLLLPLLQPAGRFLRQTFLRPFFLASRMALKLTRGAPWWSFFVFLFGIFIFWALLEPRSHGTVGHRIVGLEGQAIQLQGRLVVVWQLHLFFLLHYNKTLKNKDLEVEPIELQGHLVVIFRILFCF